MTSRRVSTLEPAETRGPPVSPLAERALAKRAARRSRVFVTLGKALLVLLPLLALSWVLLFSRWLAVDRIDVGGLERLTADQVRQAADVAPGTPLARVDTTALGERIGTLAPVADVQVHRSWPGTLSVEVTERKPTAFVLGKDERYTLYDAEGVRFATEPRLPDGVVRLQVNDPGTEDPATRAALAVYAALPPELGDRITIVRAGSPSAVVLLTDTGKQIVWGTAGDAASTATKAAAALALLAMPGDVFDVSAPGVVVRR